jgi:hypothetical protein
VVNEQSAAIRRLIVTSAVCCLLSIGSVAQQPSSGKLPDAPSATAQTQPAPHVENPDESGGPFSVLSKSSWVFPTLATGTGPLSPGQKFELAVRNSVSLATIGGAIVGAAYNQATDSPDGYGQGAEGYGKRVGAAMARSASYNLIGNFAIASVTHEDPRFYVKKNLSFMQAVKYSAVRVFATRSDDGKPVANYAGLVGPLAAEALATTYYPNGDNGVGDVFIRYASDMGWQFGGNLLRQYWPTINRKLHLLPPVPEPAPTPKKPR